MVFSNQPIIDIAILAGYQSQQAFSYVFKALYKQPPLEFRKKKVFYPLQVQYDFKVLRDRGEITQQNSAREIRYVVDKDIPMWIELAYLAVDGFPYLDEAEHTTALKRYIRNKGALLMIENDILVGGMLLNDQTGGIDFLDVHPLRRKCARFWDKTS